MRYVYCLGRVAYAAPATLALILSYLLIFRSAIRSFFFSICFMSYLFFFCMHTMEDSLNFLVLLKRGTPGREWTLGEF